MNWILVLLSVALFTRHPGMAFAFTLFWREAESWDDEPLIIATALWILLALCESNRPRPDTSRVYVAYTLREMSRLSILQRDLGRAYQQLMGMSVAKRDADKHRVAMASFHELLDYCHANAQRFDEESDLVLGLDPNTWLDRLRGVGVACVWVGLMGMGVMWDRIPSTVVLCGCLAWRYGERVREWIAHRKVCCATGTGYRDVSSLPESDDEGDQPVEAFAGVVGDVA